MYWLSFQDSVQALTGCLASVISSVEVAAADVGTESRVVLHGLSHQMRSYKFVVLTHFLADTVGILGILSKSQRSTITYCGAREMVDIALVSLLSLLTTPVPYNKAVMNDIPPNPDGSGHSSYHGLDVKDSDQERRKYDQAARSFIESLIARLEIAFPDSSVMSLFTTLSPRDSNFSQSDIEALLSYFSPFVNQEAAVTEWHLLQEVFHHSGYSHMSLPEFFRDFLHKQCDAFPNINILAAIGTIIPVSSANCERGESRYNAIKRLQGFFVGVQYRVFDGPGTGVQQVAGLQF